MTEQSKALTRGVPAVPGGGILNLLRTHTIVALLLLLLVFVAAIEIARPGTVTPLWASNMLLFAAPLGIMAAGQTLVMLTGGIDLSVATVATASAYLMATHSGLGGVPAVLWGLGVGLAVGLINGIGIALLRVQPLVMTLGTGLMAEGMLVVYSQKMMADAPRVPAFIEALGTNKLFGWIPIDLLLWAPIALLIIFVLRRTGYGRLLYAVGDNSEACQLSGIRVWRVLLVNYVTCSLLAATAGLVIVGSVDAADLSLADTLSAAVGRCGHHRRHFDLRRPRRLYRHHHRRADPDGAQQYPDAARRARADPPDPLWRNHPPARGGLYPPHRLILGFEDQRIRQGRTLLLRRRRGHAKPGPARRRRRPDARRGGGRALQSFDQFRPRGREHPRSLAPVLPGDRPAGGSG